MVCCGPSNQVAPYDEDCCDGLFLGLEGAGKTLLTRRLQSLFDSDRLKNFKPNTWPTTGVEIAIIKGELNDSFRLLRTRELGGCMGPIWPNYFSDASALVFLVDGSQPGSWREAGQKLQDILQHQHMQGKPCLVVLNKADLIGHKESPKLDTQSEAREALGWEDLRQQYDVSMVMVSALTGDNVESITRFLIEVKVGLRGTWSKQPG